MSALGDDTQLGFWPRLSTAFVSATLVFAPVYWTYWALSQFKSYNHYLNYVAVIFNGLHGWLWCMLIILVAMFVVAYPVERWILERKPKQSVMEASFVYLGVMVLAGIGFCLLQSAFPYPNDLPIVIGIALLVGAPVAAISRAIYPLLLRIPKSKTVILSILVGVAILAVGVPDQEVRGPRQYQLFPNRTEGELVRATFLNGTPATIEGMRNYVSAAPSNPHQKYSLVIGCDQSKEKVTFEATVLNAKTGRVIDSSTLPCSRGGGISTQIGDIKLGNHRVHLSLKLRIIDGPKAGPGVPIAYAVVAKAGLPW